MGLEVASLSRGTPLSLYRRRLNSGLVKMEKRLA